MDIWNWISGTFYDLLCSLGKDHLFAMVVALSFLNILLTYLSSYFSFTGLLYKTGNLVLIGLDNAGKVRVDIQ